MEFTSAMAASSERDGDGNAFLVPLRILLSLSLLASISAASSRDLALGSSSLMNLSADGHTRGSADDGFSSAAHATCPRFTATSYGILLQEGRKPTNPPQPVSTARNGLTNAVASDSLLNSLKATLHRHFRKKWSLTRRSLAGGGRRPRRGAAGRSRDCRRARPNAAACSRGICRSARSSQIHDKSFLKRCVFCFSHKNAAFDMRGEEGIPTRRRHWTRTRWRRSRAGRGRSAASPASPRGAAASPRCRPARSRSARNPCTPTAESRLAKSTKGREQTDGGVSGATKANQDSDTGEDLAAERMVRRQSAWP